MHLRGNKSVVLPGSDVSAAAEVKYQSAENLPRHIRSTEDRSDQFHRATNTYRNLLFPIWDGIFSISLRPSERSAPHSLEAEISATYSRTGATLPIKTYAYHVRWELREGLALDRFVQKSPEAPAADGCNDDSVPWDEVMKKSKQINTRVERVGNESDQPTASVSSSDSAGSEDYSCNISFNPSPLPPAVLSMRLSPVPVIPNCRLQTPDVYPAQPGSPTSPPTINPHLAGSSSIPLLRVKLRHRGVSPALTLLHW
ncbi:hypothetical protein GX48_00414 [Paracoccidioides brasiliensis]|nr:hypothetical protein GX48_00414 [Paracoccidioides brasiliensis]